MAGKRVTLSDIAKRDGSHVTTVSLAMRNSPKLPEATKKRIQKLAKEMGYVPDPALGALASYRRRAKETRSKETLAYVTNWTSRWGWKDDRSHAQFYEGATEAADAIGYQLEHFWLSEPGMTHSRFSKILFTRGIRGIIIASHSREHEAPLELDWKGFSCIKIDFFPHKPQLPNVSNDQCGSVRLAFQKALESGAKRIGLVMHRGWDMSVDRMWTAGFLVEQYLVEEKDRLPVCYFPAAEPREVWENETEVEVKIDTARFKEWYEKWKPEVIIGNRVFIADAMKELGLEAPRDFGLIDLFLYEKNGKDAGIVQNHRFVGATAINMLASRLMRNDLGLPTYGRTSFVEADWTDGESLPTK
ncbi:LacI family DNA-binding transcriptional regulator [Pelagicoccus albus]|uniref:LacI family DNA-binding transcriptional regulator n=1 Tax=Pelagicoccus albus TaxID=415222 RepID=A0A7X1EAH4_9BACT|nr:LacI family DNA-binding transcriptional regulator [Pelagicoccus albus]MBC2606772.1 LacI family DNA-binding transcriptional regulator [Pelagicoccus albus]